MSKPRRPDESLLDRLNRGAGEYRDLWDVLGKLLVPIVVSVLGLAGVVLTVVLTLVSK